MFLGEISQIQTQTINGWPDLSHKKLTRPDPGQKFLTQTHHYLKSNLAISSRNLEKCSIKTKQRVDFKSRTLTRASIPIVEQLLRLSDKKKYPRKSAYSVLGMGSWLLTKNIFMKF